MKAHCPPARAGGWARAGRGQAVDARVHRTSQSFDSIFLLDIGPDSGANAQVSFSFGTNTNNVARQWEIKVTQVECWSNSRPIDSGCDQYYTGTTGRIQSYNFGQTASTSFAHLPSQR